MLKYPDLGSLPAVTTSQRMLSSVDKTYSGSPLQWRHRTGFSPVFMQQVFYVILLYYITISDNSQPLQLTQFLIASYRIF